MTDSEGIELANRVLLVKQDCGMKKSTQILDNIFFYVKEIFIRKVILVETLVPGNLVYWLCFDDGNLRNCRLQPTY